MNIFKKYVLLFLLLWISKDPAQEKKDFVDPIKSTNEVVTDTLPKDKKKNYNRWSFNVNGGINVGVRPFTSGYYATTANYLKDPDFNHVDINIRKMFNTKFGLRLDFVYDHFKAENGSLPFNNKMYRVDLQGVMNMHRIMNWEEFTDTFGLQLHLGPGFSFLQGPRTTTFNHYDNIFSILGGATVLVKLSDRMALSGDYTLVGNLTHHLALDGKSSLDPSLSRSGTLYSTTLGFTYYFGKKQKHADWYWEKGNNKKDNKDLIARIEALENALAEKGSLNDDIKTYINNNFGDKKENNNLNNNYTNIQMKDMINGQYVNVFFDFDETRITPGSISAINFLVKYLNANPKAKAEVIGYADELGDFNYNINLSKRRAERVMEMIVRSGIDSSRLNLAFKGEDNSVPKESKLARQLVRRVAFKVTEE